MASWLIKTATRRDSFSDPLPGQVQSPSKAVQTIKGVGSAVGAGAITNSSGTVKQEEGFQVDSDLWKSEAQIERERLERLLAPKSDLHEEEEDDKDSEARSEIISIYSVWGFQCVGTAVIVLIPGCRG